MQRAESIRHLVVAMGAFDGVHLGHQALIHQVLTIAERDHLTSGVVTFEPHPQLVLHPERPFRLITLEREKELLLHQMGIELSLIHISEPTRLQLIAYAVAVRYRLVVLKG